MPWNKTDRSFKTLINKRVTDSDAKFYFNEKGDFTINTHQLELWVDAIPSTAPGATTDIVEYYNTLTLVEDTSVPSKQAWFATSNASTVPAQTDETSRLKNWVSDKYGSTYEIVLYDTSNVQIPPSDGCGWFFDYQTGILTFTSTTTTTGGGGSLSSRAPFKIKGYRYIGRTGIDGNIIKNEVRVATTPATSFSGWSYSSELIDTGVTSTSLTIDGISLNTTEGLTGDRILIKNWSTLSNNGIYYVERAGDGASDTWRFRRAPDFNDTQDIFPGTMVFVRSGTVNARTVWSMSNASFTTLDAGGATGEITFAQFITATTRWSALTAPDANLSLTMSTNTTTFNWATGTSTNNLFSLTTDASANGTGALLNIATGSSSTVLPLLVKAGATTALTVNASAQVLIGTLTNGRVTYAGASGLLQDSANMTFDGNRVALATTGNTGGLLIGGDANLYRSAADTLKTDDSLIIGVNLSVLNAGTLSLYESGSVNFSSFAAGTQANDLRYTLPTTQPATNQILSASAVTGSGPYDITLAWVTPATSGITIGDGITGSTVGSVLFVGAGSTLAQDNANFFWDDTNNTLGIGTTRSGAISGTNPSVRIKGTGTSSATSSFEVQDSGAASLFLIRDDGLINFGSSGTFTNSTGRLALSTTGSGAGILLGGDANLYRSAADVLKTDDSFVVGVNLSVLNAGTFSLYESGSVNFSSFAAGTQANDLRYTLPTTQPSTNQILSASAVTGSGPYDITLAWVTPATSGITIGDGITGSTVGSVLFVGAGSTLAQDNANFFWDDTNNTLGIGTTRTGAISGTNPSVRILGTGSTSATSAFEVQDSTTATLFFIRNDGYVGIGTNAPTSHFYVTHTLSTDASLTLHNNILTITSAETGRNIRTVFNQMTLNTSGAIAPSGSAIMPNVWNQLVVAGAHTGAITTPTYGLNNEVQIAQTGSATHTLISGVRSHYNLNTGADGTITTADSFISTLQSGTAVTSTITTFTHYNTSYSLSGSPVIGTLTGLDIKDPGAGTVTTQYGIRVRDQSRGSTNYALYFDGTSGLARQGIWWNGDVNLYRSAADTLKTDDSLVVGANLSVLNAGTFSLYESGSVNFSSFAAGTQANDLRYTLPTSQPSTNQVLTATSITGSGPYDITLGWVTNSASITIGDAVNSGTAGSILFVGTGPVLAQDNANLYWDDTNNTLGIGTTRTGAISGTNPSVRILGTGSSSATSSFEVQNSGASTILFVRNDGRLGIGTNAPSNDLSFGGEAARTIALERRGTGAGNNLTIQAGGAQSGASGANGGNLILSSGISTGGGTSVVDIRVSDGLSFGTSDNTPATALYLTGTGSSFYTTTQSYYVTFGIPMGVLAIDPFTFTMGMVANTGSSGHILSIYGGSTSGGTDLAGGDLNLYAGDSTGTGSSNIYFFTATAGTTGTTVRTSSLKMTLTGAGQLQVSTTGSSAGILLGGDAQIYRSAADVLRTPDSLTVDSNLTVAGTASIGSSGGTTGTINLLGSTSGTVSVLVQAAAGTYNFNLPTTAGTSGYVLTSAGGGASAMTWTDPATLAVRWNSIANPNGNQSLTMSTNTTTWNWATGTSTNNLFNLTTDASANGTGALLRVATGASSTVVPMLIVAAGTTALTVNASAQVLVNSLTSGRVTYAGTNGLLQDSANMTFDGNQLSLVTAGSSGGLLIGSDVQIYRASANTMSFAASDSLEIPSGQLGVGQTAPTSGSRVGITYNATVGSGTERAILYTGAVSAAHTGFYNIMQSEGSTTNSTGTVNWISGALNRIRAQSTGGTVSVIYGLHNLAWMDSASGTPTYTTNIGAFNEAAWSNTSFTGTATVSSNIALYANTGHATISGGGTVSISSEYGLLIGGSVNTGISVSNRYGIRIADPTGSTGTLTTQYGLYFEDLDRASTNYGLYFAGTSGLSRQGIWWNGDVNLYRSAADVLATDDNINLAASNREVRFTNSGFSSGGVLFNSNMRFSAHATGGFSFLPQNVYAHTTSSNQTIYISASFSPSSASAGSMYGIYNALAYDDGSTTGNFTGEIIGSNNVTTFSSYQAGSHTFNRGIAVKGYLSIYDDNSGSGAITTNAYGGWFEVNDESSSARITNAYGLYALLNAPYSQNNQTRYGLYVDAMPNPGAFTGTTTAAIRLVGTGGARDGILFGSDTNLYRSAADTLKTDDSLVVAVNLTVNSLTSGRVPFASTSGLLVDSSAFTYTTGTGQLALATTGSGAGILLGGDAQIYRSAADVLRTPDSLTVDVNLTVSGTASIGAVGGTTGTINLLGSTSGTVSVLVQAAAGTYNFNLPTTAGSSGHVLTSGGGGATAMTWTDPASLAVRWNSIANPNGAQSLTMSTHTTTWNWATGTSTNNLFNLTTDASANGTGALLRVATGTSSTVVPLLVVAAGTTALTVNASAQVLVGTLTNGRVTYAGASGLLQDSANMTFDGSRVSLATTGNTGGLLIGGDANLYRSAADVLKTDDSFVVGVNLSVLNAGTFSLYESGSVNFSSFAAGTQANDLRYTLPTSQPTTNQVLTATAISGTGPYDITLGWASPSATISIGSGITSGTAGSVLFVGAGAVLAQDNSNFFWDDTNNYLGLGTAATPAARLHVAGDQTASAWTTNGVLLRVGAATLTDSSSTGTVAASVANAIQTPTFAASSATTYTDAATLYISANPTAGTNVTITNGYALWVDSGATRLDGNLIVGSLTSTRIPYASTGGLLVDSANMTFNGNRIALATTGNTGGLLIGGDTNLYRSGADVLTTDDSFTTGGSISAGTNIIASSGYLSTGSGGGGFLGEVRILGDTSGTISILPQSSAGTYNFNLPTTAGSSGYVLTSGGGGGSPMTWTDPGALAVRWNSIANPTGSQSLTMSTNTTTWNWATGTSTNNLFNLTTDASANGTGALLRVATGTSSTVVPMLIVAAGTTALTVNASAQVLVNSLTSTRVVFAGTSGLLTDSSNFTYTTGTGQLALATSGSGAGILLGGDAQIYRDSADVLRTPDSIRIDGSIGVNAAAPATTAGRVQVTGTHTSLSADYNNITSNMTHTVNSPDTTTGRAWALRFSATQAGSGIFNDGASFGATGVEGLAEFTGSGSSVGVTGASVLARNTSTGTLTRATGLVVVMSSANSGGGHITNLRPIDISWSTAFSANNQVRCAMRIGAGPTNHGSFSGSITGGIYFNSSSRGVQDGIIWGTGGDTNLYSSATDTLKTDDSFVVGTNLTVSSLTSTRVPFMSTSGLFVDSANFTYTTGTGQLALATTGSGAGLMVGGDALIYRSAANTMSMGASDSFEIPSGFLGVGVAAPTSATRASFAYTASVGSGTERIVLYNGGVTSAHTGFFNNVQSEAATSHSTGTINWIAGALNRVRLQSTGGTVTSSYGLHNMAWMDSASGTVTYSNNTGVQCEALWNNASFTGTATVSNNIAINAYNVHTTISGGGTVSITSDYGLYAQCSVNTGITITSRYGIRIADTTGSTGTLTTQYGLYFEDLDRASTNYGIYFAGTSGASRQGIWWNGDVNLYRSAADTLRTDDAFISGSTITGASSLTLGANGGTTGSVLMRGTTSGTVTVTVASAAGTWSMTLPTSGGTNGYVLTTNGSGTTSWNAPGIPWTEVTGTSASASAHNGYLANNAALVTITLPTPAVGSVIEIVGVGAGGWRAQCATSHTIRMGTTVSASTGYAQSTNQYDCIKIIGISATAWLISSAVGTIDIT